MNKIKIIKIIMIITIKIMIKLCTWNMKKICSLISLAMNYQKRKKKKKQQWKIKIKENRNNNNDNNN